MEEVQNKYIYKINKSYYINDEFKNHITTEYGANFIGISPNYKNKIFIYVQETQYGRISEAYKEEIEKGWVEIFKIASKYKIIKD